MSGERSAVTFIRIAAAAVLAVVPLAYWTHTIYPYLTLRVTFFQAAVEIMTAVWLPLAILFPRYRPRLTPVSGTLVLLFLALLLSAGFGIDFWRSVWSTQERMIGIFFLGHALLFFFIVSAVANGRWWRWFWWCSLGAALAVTLGAVLERFFIPDIFQSRDSFRASSLLGNPSALAGYLLLSVFIGLSVVVSGNAGWRRWTAIVATAVSAAGIFLTQTLGALAGLAGGLMALALTVFVRLFPFAGRRHRLYGAAAAAGVLLVITAVIVFFFAASGSSRQPIPGFTRFVQRGSLNSLHNRLLVWQAGGRAFWQRPVLGWGWENFNAAFNLFYPAGLIVPPLAESHWDKPHNIVLEYLYTAGSIGLMAFAAAVAAAGYEVFRTRRRPECLCIAAGLAAYFVQGLVTFDTAAVVLMVTASLAFIDFCYREVTGSAPADNALRSVRRQQRSWAFSVALCGIVFVVAAAPLYFINYRIAAAGYRQYWSIIYYLNGLLPQSYQSWQAAMAIVQPYRDDVRFGFANNLQQAYEAGLIFEPVAETHRAGISALRAVIAGHPRNYLSYWSLAEFYNTFHQFNPFYLEEAERVENQAERFSPGRLEVVYARAKTALLKGRREEGYALLERAVAINPEVPASHFYLALVLMERNDFQRGRQELRRAEGLGYQPKNTREAMVAGNLLGDAGFYDEAIAVYDRAARNFPSPLSTQQQLLDIKLKIAVASFFKGDEPRARAEFLDLSRTVDLKSVPLYSTLEPVLRKLGIRL